MVRMTLVRMSASKVTELCNRIRVRMNTYENADHGRFFSISPYSKADRKRTTRILDLVEVKVNSAVDLTLEDVVWLLKNAGPSVEL